MINEQYFNRRVIKRDRLRSKARRMEYRVRRLYRFIRFCLTILLLYGIYYIANISYWYLPDNIFETGNNIKIVGNNLVTNKQILNTLKTIPQEHKPIYKINPEKMTKTLEKLAPIEKVYIRRYWLPSRLVIMVQEVIPAVIICKSENTNEVAAYSFDGKYIGAEYLPIKNKTHSVKVLSNDYQKWDIKQINKIYKLVKLVEYYSGEKVKYLDLRIPNNAFIQLNTVKVRLGLIDIGVFERIKELSSILTSEEIRKKISNTNYIDLSWSNVRYLNINNE